MKWQGGDNKPTNQDFINDTEITQDPMKNLPAMKIDEMIEKMGETIKDSRCDSFRAFCDASACYAGD